MKKSFEQIRADFPMLDEQNIAYLDSAASSQKPISVIKRVKSTTETRMQTYIAASIALVRLH